MSTDAPISREPGRGVTLSEWNESFDLFTPLLPMDYRSYDPVEALEGLRKAFDTLPKTRATVRLTDIAHHLPAPATEMANATPLVELAGGWRLRANNESYAVRYVNPNYVHAKALEPNITDPERREDVLQRCAGYGILTLEEVAPRFGIRTESLQRWLNRKDILWSDWRQEGVQRIARTCYVISEWEAHSVADLADVLDMPRGTLSRWMHENAGTTDFDPPADPSYEPWFALTHWSEEKHRKRGDQA